MAEVNMSQTQIKYLSDQGLLKLWEKISNTFLRDSEVVDALTVSGEGKIITSADDVFVQKKTLDAATTSLSERIEEVAAAQGTNIDDKTIVNKNGVLQTSLFLLNDSDNHVLKIVTTEGDASTSVTEWDYTEFYQEAVKDGILESASLVVVPGDEAATDGRSEGTYLKLVFNSSSGKDPIYINVTDLIDVYAGSDYISVDKVDGSSTISLKTTELVEYLKTDDALGVTSLVTRVEAVVDQMSALETIVSDLQNAWKDYESDITHLQEQITANAENVTSLMDQVKAFPNTPISDDDIDNLV